MKRFVLFLLGLLPPLCLSFHAQPSGTFHFPAQGGLHSPQAIWDLTGTYKISVTIEGVGELSFDLPLVQDVRGKLSGPAVIVLKSSSNEMLCTAKVRGKASGTSQNFNASVTIGLSGTGEFIGEVRNLKGSFALNLRVDPGTAHLVGSMSVNGTVSGAGSASVTEPVAYPLPPGMTGGWSLTLNLQPAATKLAGDATVNLSNGRSLPFALSGSFSTKDGRAKLKMKGADAAQGAKLGVNTTGVPPVLNKLSGGVLGVTLD